MKKLFTLPTWQIFILLIAPYFFPSDNLAVTILTTIWALFFVYSVFLLGDSLFKKLPEGHDLKIKRFYFSLLFPAVYVIAVYILFPGGFEINQNNYRAFGWWLLIILPFHLFAMFCIFYVIWFIAKSIATIENNKVVGFDHYSGNFFLLWFYPIGIWFVHPKVRKIFSLDAKPSL
jgi:hypothetical protein